MDDLKTNWDEVRELYDKGLTDQELADNFKIKKNTVRMHRSRNKWGKANRKKNVSNVSKKRAHVSKPKSDTRTKKDTETVIDDDVAKPLDTNSIKSRYEKFCWLYLQSYNATKAYQKTYKCSHETAMAAGSRLLSNVKVQRMLDDLQKEQAKKLHASTFTVMLNYLKQMNASLGDYIDSRTIKVQRKDEDGNPKSDAEGNPIFDYQTEIWLKDLHNVDLSVVDEIHKGKDGIVVKLANRQHAMDKLIERLPEPIDNKPQTNTFLSAVKESKHVFDEDEEKRKKAKKST